MGDVLTLLSIAFCEEGKKGEGGGRGGLVRKMMGMGNKQRIL